jgi:hypothetical protein
VTDKPYIQWQHTRPDFPDDEFVKKMVMSHVEHVPRTLFAGSLEIPENVYLRELQKHRGKYQK